MNDTQIIDYGSEKDEFDFHSFVDEDYLDENFIQDLVDEKKYSSDDYTQYEGKTFPDELETLEDLKVIGTMQDEFEIGLLNHSIYNNTIKCKNNFSKSCKIIKMMKDDFNPNKFFPDAKIMEKNKNSIILKSEKNNDFLLKININKSLPIYDKFLHEACIAMLCTNEYQNFEQIYGFFTCKTAINIPKKICSISEKGMKNHIILENIKNSVKFSEYVLKCTPREMTSVFIQVFMALKEANENYDFCHYDLHNENVLVADSNSRQFIDNKNLKYPNTAKILDFETSRIKIGQNYISSIGSDVILERYNDSEPLYDVYKLICFTTRELYINKMLINEKLGIIRQMFLPFTGNKDFVEYICEKEFDFYRLYQDFPELMGKGLKIKDYLNQLNPEIVNSFL